MSGERVVKRRGGTSPLADWETATALPDGRHIEIGDEFTVPGVGRFRLRAIRPTGELTGWGPIASNGAIPHGGMRSFRPETVRTVHTTARAQDTLREQEDN
jgi:hypothetical protein